MYGGQSAEKQALIPSHITLPRPEEFGLPPSFDMLDYLDDERLILKRLDGRSTTWSVVLAVAIAALFALDVSDSRGTPFWANMVPAMFIALVLSVPLKTVIGKLPAFQRRDPIKREAEAYRDALMATKAAIDDWNDRQLETGLGYWRAQRGVSFEVAVRDLLQRRGCRVTTTKGSGDGGIDLMVVVGGETICCQCKGHAAPVGVGPVREIAGVCSQGIGKPALIAVNGFTKAAISTASELGVILVDAPQLTSMAQKQKLTAFA